MTRLVRAEWTKLFTTRVWLGLLLGACLMVGLFSALITAFAGEPAGNGGPALPPVGNPVYEQLALAVSAETAALFLILGIIGMTQEYRHRTATPTFLTTPRRWRVVVGKLIAYALAAVPMVLVVVAVNVAVVSVYAGARGAAPSPTSRRSAAPGSPWCSTPSSGWGWAPCCATRSAPSSVLWSTSSSSTN